MVATPATVATTGLQSEKRWSDRLGADVGQRERCEEVRP
jgi:hypothetical protein